jgi:hypothetical protein
VSRHRFDVTKLLAEVRNLLFPLSSARSVPDSDNEMDVDTHLNNKSSTDAEKVPEPVLDPDFNDTSADVVLKSSDNVLFRVASHHLKSNR